MDNVSEMSERVNPFGRATCDQDGYTGVWVQFKTSGYPFGLRRKWDKAKTDEALAIVLSYVEAWNLPDISGKVVTLTNGQRTIDLVDDVEDVLVLWLMRAFSTFWLTELPYPRKN